MPDFEDEDMLEGGGADFDPTEGLDPLGDMKKLAENRNGILGKLLSELTRQGLASADGQGCNLQIEHFHQKMLLVWDQTYRQGTGRGPEMMDEWEHRIQIFLKNHVVSGSQVPFEVFSAIMSRLRFRINVKVDREIQRLWTSRRPGEPDMGREYDEKICEIRDHVNLKNRYLLECFANPMREQKADKILAEYKLREGYKALGWRVLKSTGKTPFQKALWIVQRFLGWGGYPN